MTETQITTLIQTMNMATRWQRHGNAMATNHGIHTHDGKHMATSLQHNGNKMAIQWQPHGNYMATICETHLDDGKYMATTWQHDGNNIAAPDVKINTASDVYNAMATT